MRKAIGAAALAAGMAMSGGAAGQEKLSMQLFHFNVQYVAGGTLGYWPTPDPALDLDNDAIEDLIIVESLEPVIDLLVAHPSWGADIEMQAYMLDIIADRHPELLAKIRDLAQSGQIDVLSFHYGDALFLGYPLEDWTRSQALTAERFAVHDVPLSTSVFCQEGQAAPMMAPRMQERGYELLAWPKNLFRYQHGDEPAPPLYQLGEVLMLQAGKGVSYTDGSVSIESTWTFFDDGELLATNDVNPYFPDVFKANAEAIAEYETRLLDLEADGWQLVTMREYAAAVLGTGYEPEPAPPLLDGTWQPDSTGGIARWLGGAGLSPDERDNHVRTVGAQAHRELVAAEAIATEAGLDARPPLDAAWRLLHLGQVTDATGINPFQGEVEYGIAHMGEATRIARDVIHEAKAALGRQSVLIDPAGAIGEGAAPFGPGEIVAPPIELEILALQRDVTQTWEKLAEGHHRVTIDLGPSIEREVTVTFPGTLEDTFSVGLALDDGSPTQVERSDFVWDEFHFALPTGYIGLGGGRFVIKDMGHVHLAALVRRDSGDVTFVDSTVPEDENARWVFHVVDASAADAAQLAIELNVARRLVR